MRTTTTDANYHHRCELSPPMRTTTTAANYHHCCELPSLLRTTTTAIKYHHCYQVPPLLPSTTTATNYHHCYQVPPLLPTTTNTTNYHHHHKVKMRSLMSFAGACLCFCESFDFMINITLSFEPSFNFVLTPNMNLFIYYLFLSALV